jgi:hypothetical protein
MKRDADRLKAQRKERANKIEELKTLSQLCSAAQKDVNKYIMARDRAAGYGCISCGSPDITEAGHYFHAGSKYRCSRLRFDHRNINAQCNSCNQHKGGGNQHEYRLGFIRRYGQEAFDALCETKRKADRRELEPITKTQAREIAKEHRQMARELRAKHGTQ